MSAVRSGHVSFDGQDLRSGAYLGLPRGGSTTRTTDRPHPSDIRAIEVQDRLTPEPPPNFSIQRISMTGTLQARIIAVVVEPMIRLRMRLWP